MKLPKNYFENLSADRYREFLKILPDIHNENTRITTTLILTFTAMSFFGIFAISPTLTTIITLEKQLKDSELVNERLETKINSLSNLQQEYSLIEPDLPIIFNAIPKDPQPPNALSQAIGLAHKTKVQITDVSVLETPLSNIKGSENKSSFSFNLQAKGSYDNLSSFTKSLTKIGRVLSIDSIAISQDPKNNILIFDIRLQSYYKRDLKQ